MGRHAGGTDYTNKIVLQPQITRVFWSKRRAWHGAKLKLHVETRHVPDGTKLTLEVWEDDSTEASADDFVDAPKGDFVVKGGRCVVDYQLKWDEKSLGEPLELEGDSLEFYFKVRAPDFELERRSDLLYVDLHAFSPSI